MVYDVPLESNKDYYEVMVVVVDGGAPWLRKATSDVVKSKSENLLSGCCFGLYLESGDLYPLAFS